MTDHQAHKKFAFHESIDKDFIFSLYEDDYSYICEMFLTCIDSIDQCMDALQYAYVSGDIDQVNKVAHKLKPVFGFTGLLGYQDRITHFENFCNAMEGTRGLKKQFELLLTHIEEGKSIITQESFRLQKFTGITA